MKTRLYELEWRYEERVATEHLGSQKYSTSSRAIGELIANSLDAGAKSISVDLTENKLGELNSVVLDDNGTGISPFDIKNRFVLVGVKPGKRSDVSARLGRLGVGRLAVHRIGDYSEWSTIAIVNGRKIRSSFTLRTDEHGPLKVSEEEVDPDTPTGTTIEIFNVRDTGKERLTKSRISNEVLGQYCSYLLAHPDRQIQVCGQVLDVNELVQSRDSETITASDDMPTDAAIQHVVLRRSVDQSRFPDQVLFSAKGRTVASVQPEPAPAPNYLGVVECDYLDSLVTSNRELLVQMDDMFARLKDTALARIGAYQAILRSRRSKSFIEVARREEYYPYRNVPADSVSNVEQAFYDVVLEKVHETANLQNMTRKQQEIVFRLLKRSLDNENVLQVLQEVAKLSDEDIELFRKILERTTLESIIKLSSEVTSRLSFLEVLHQLVYGDFAKHLKERTQLHKLIDSQCWVFGPKFHLATSDQSFREIIRKHRRKAGLPDIPDLDIEQLKGIADIPDLFLAATREYPVQPRHHHVLVELKAPNVSLGPEELRQVRRYAETILDSHEFDKTSTYWDLFLVSAKAGKQIERDRQQKDKPHGCVFDWENMRVWALEWSEIISNARDEMNLVRAHLRQKSEELSVSDYLREKFPDILSSLTKPTAAGQ